MRCRISLRLFAIGVLAIVLAPSVAHAQSTIAGVVKDASGAVLPGVTVEAASPVLIEKTRTVVTNSEGRSAIVDIRPGNLHSDVHADRVQHVQARRRLSFVWNENVSVNS